MRVCGIAGFLLFELKSAESVENAGIFRGDTGWHPVCKKTFWFSAVPCGRILSSACFGRSPLIILGQRGVVLGGVLGKDFANPRKIFSRVTPYAPVKIRISHAARLQSKRISHSLTAT